MRVSGQAGMAELVDAPDSKSGDGNIVGVRFPLPAPLCESQISVEANIGLPMLSAQRGRS
jgi:hypothetical protein